MTNHFDEDFLAKYNTVTSSCGFFPLANWSSISIQGADRNKFVHNMCTNEISKLSPGGGCEAFFVDVKGKIVAHTIILAQEDELVLLTVPNQAESLISHLDRYVIREDVQLKDESTLFTWLIVLGPQASQILSLNSSDNAAESEQSWQNKPLMLNGVPSLIARADILRPRGYLLRCQNDSVENFTQMLGSSSVKRISDPVWNAIRIESGLPQFGVDFDKLNLPQEVARSEQAINFNKGCYLGQETVARIDALGHVNKQIVTLQFSEENIPDPGTKITDDEKNVGTVTSACWSPRLSAPLALATVRRGSNQIGHKLNSDFGTATVASNNLECES